MVSNMHKPFKAGKVMDYDKLGVRVTILDIALTGVGECMMWPSMATQDACHSAQGGFTALSPFHEGESMHALSISINSVDIRI